MGKKFEQYKAALIINQNDPSIEGVCKFIIAIFVITITLFVSISSKLYIPLYTFLGNILMTKLGSIMDYIVLTIYLIAFGFTILISWILPKDKFKKRIVNQLFSKGNFDIITRFFAVILTTMFVKDIGPEWLLGEETGLIMYNASKAILIWIGLSVFLIPLFSNYGLGEFFSIILQPVMRPLFKVSSKGAFSLVASLLMNPTFGVIITDEQFEKGQLSNREAAVIMTTLCVPSLVGMIAWMPFLRLSNVFPLVLIAILVTIFFLGNYAANLAIEKDF